MPVAENVEYCSLTNVGAAAAQASGWASSALWIQPVAGAGSQETLLEKTDFIVQDGSPDSRSSSAHPRA